MKQLYKLEIEPSETLHAKIERVDLHNLEKEVKNRGLEWKKFGDDD